MQNQSEITKQQLLEDLTRIGIKKGAVLAVHIGYKSIGRVKGGPQTVVDALMESVTETGTLLMPVFNSLTNGTTDLRTAPSCVGIVTEFFRKTAGVIRSDNPTHSCAIWGKDARKIADTHLHTTQLGENTPFHEIAKRDGTVLHMGCEFNSCSIVHVAEVLAKVPYLTVGYPGYESPIKYINPLGHEKVFNSDENPGDGSGFRVVQWEMDRRGLLNHGMIGEAKSFWAKGTQIIDLTLEMLKRDPAALLCHNSHCMVCPQSHRMVGDFLEKNKKQTAFYSV